MSSAGDWAGVGDWTSTWATNEKGALCGRGDISMESPRGAGDEEGGSGGVVTYSAWLPNVNSRSRTSEHVPRVFLPRPSEPSIRWEVVNSARRGVGN